MKRFAIEHVVVRKFKSGKNEGEYRSFAIPDGAYIVSVAYVYESMVVYYAVPTLDGALLPAQAPTTGLGKAEATEASR